MKIFIGLGSLYFFGAYFSDPALVCRPGRVGYLKLRTIFVRSKMFEKIDHIDAIDWVNHFQQKPTFRTTDFSFFFRSEAPRTVVGTVVGGAHVVSGAEKKTFDRGGPVWPPRSNVTNDRLSP